MFCTKSLQNLDAKIQNIVPYHIKTPKTTIFSKTIKNRTKYIGNVKSVKNQLPFF